MKQLLNKIILVSLLMLTVNVFGQVGYEIEIGTDESDDLTSFFIRAKDGGFVGIVYENYCNKVLKISPIGDTTSRSIIKSDTILLFGSIISVESLDYSYLVIGQGTLNENDFSDRFTLFIALDVDLNLVWEKIYDFDFYYHSTSEITMQLKDSNFLYVCSPFDNKELYFFKLSKYGDSLDYRYYGNDSSGSIRSINYNIDSSKIFLHTEYAYYDPMGPQSQIITIEEDTWEQEEVRYYPRWLRAPYTAIVLPDGDILNGATFNNATYNGRITAYRLNDDSLLSVQKVNKLTSPDSMSRAASYRSIDYYYSGNYYFGGSINVQYFQGDTPNWYYISKLDDNLDLEFEKYIGGDAYYWLISVTADTDGGVLLAGTKYEIGTEPFQRNIYIIKLDSLSTITGKINNSIKVYDAIVYPNPGRNKLYVRTALKGCFINLYSISGELVIRQVLDENITLINTSMLSSGTYIYRIEKDTKLVETGKWIKK